MQTYKNAHIIIWFFKKGNTHMGLENKLDHYLSCNLNCLLRGEHGVGKTTLVSECFQRNGLVIGETALIFSAATIDPWVDFIGVPKEVTKDGKRYLDFIQPKHFVEDKVEAIFFDEFNRSHKKIRNAVLELIQFKSINGKRFDNLKVVWAAINPEDSEEYQYDVEVLDPAQKDRFQIILDVPYKPDYTYFSNKYSEDWASSAIDWWKDLPSKVRKQVSPRRLDYALEVFKLNGDLADVLPHEASPRRLGKVLKEGSPKTILSGLLNSNKNEELKDFLDDTNNVETCMPDIVKYKKHMQRCLPIIKDEILISAIFKHNGVKDHIEKTLNDIRQYQDPIESSNKEEIFKYSRVLNDICKSDTDRSMSNWASSTLSSCIPGFMLVSGPGKMTLSQIVENIKDRYDFNSPVSVTNSSKEKDPFKKIEISDRLSGYKKEIEKRSKTPERQLVISEVDSLIRDNYQEIDNYGVVLDIVNLFCSRSQKKTINSNATLNNILYLSDWGINAFALQNEMDTKSTEKLIKKIPHILTKCIIGEIEEKKEFSIFSLKERAKVFQDITKK